MRSARNTNRHRRLLVTLAFIASLLEWIVVVRSENTEIPLVPSGTDPKRIRMPIGGNANITCHVFDDENSSMIWFKEKNFNKTIRQPNKNIIIIDDKTAVLTLYNVTEHIYEYYCMSEKTVGKTEVFVGSPPAEVKDFKCRAYDFKYMTCTFTRPYNLIYTSYELNYTDSPYKFCSRTCMDLVVNGDQFICNLTMRSDSFYVSNQDMYYFNITGTNDLGSRSQIEVINHYNSVVPAKFDIKLESITTDSVKLTWQNEDFTNYKKVSLEYEILLQPNGSNSYFETDYDYCKDFNCSVVIKNLEYAYYDYALRVRTKVKEAPNVDDMWSEPFQTKFRTKAKKPAYPPQTAPGSFSIDSKLHLFWKDLKPYEHSGPNFHYVIFETDTLGNIINVTNTNMSTISLPWFDSKLRVYHIKSANDEGFSSNSSVIKVFPQIPLGKAYEPGYVVKEYQNSTYVLSWKPPKERAGLSNYTIFWCESKGETKNRCSGTIHFTVVDKHLTNFTSDLKNVTLNLAVSANYENYSAGMHWALCYADESVGLIKLEPKAAVVAAKTIEIYWSLDRICSTIIEGFNLTYCQIRRDTNLNDKPAECITKPITLQLDGDLKDFTIRDLNPYSKYLIHMLMYSKSKVGPLSEPKLIETKQAASTSPRNLTVIQELVTSKSVAIYWLPPDRFNGIIKYYTIYVERITKDDEKAENFTLNLKANPSTSFEGSNDPINFTINNLKGYTEYKISVSAYTVESSPSASIKVRTLIGVPPSLKIVNNTKNGNKVSFQWDEPSANVGRLQFYEVAIIIKSDENKTTQQIISTNNNKCQFRVPECRDSDFRYEVKVRAVFAANKSEIDENVNDNYLKDPQKEGVYLECSESEPLQVQSLALPTPYEWRYSSNWKIVENTLVQKCSEKFSVFSAIAIILFFVLIVVSGYGVCKKYKKMNNIDVVLPPGLVDNISYKINGNMGCGNKSDQEQSTLSRSNDCLVNNKENFRLLSSLNTNSGTAVNDVIITPEHIDEDRKFHFITDYNHELQREETSNGSYDDQNSSQSTDSVEINDLSSVSFSNYQMQNDSQKSNYVPQNIISTIPALNGYVSITPKNNVNNGYITADKLNSFQTNYLQDENSKKNLNDINSNTSSNMYVTPAKLAQISRFERLH